MSQRIVNGDASAHERSGFFRRHIIGNCRQRFGRRDYVFGITAVKVDAGDLAGGAHRKIAAPALVAHKIVSAMPANTNALTFVPVRNVISNRIDASGDFMSGDAWILKAGPQSFFDENIAMTNAARFNFHAHLSRSWLRNFSFD